MSKSHYYNPKNILAKNARYNIVIGQRSNGKTYACLKMGVERYHKRGEQTAIVRRWSDDFTGKRGATMFDALTVSGEISKITGGEWSSVYYYASRWYLCRYDDKGNRETDDCPFAYGFSISAMEHDKSTSYPKITLVIFDEFITRTMYLPDEFVLFMNVISTIKRDRTNVIIFMLGNTVNKFCPYFNEMGLTHIKQQKQGTIDVYQYGESDLTVAVEYCQTSNKASKDTDAYFAFDNPKLSMITGGTWEINIYPHCPVKFTPGEILFTYFIIFDGDILQCEIVKHDKLFFTFIHRKTSELKNPDADLIYSPEYDPRPNWKRLITRPTTDIENRVASFYKTDKVFYQDNEVGEIVRNYLQYCGKAVK